MKKRRVKSRLDGFRGDPEFIVANEYKGRPYVPSDSTGVTLDINVDLSETSVDFVTQVYGHVLDNDQIWACRRCIGLHGNDARMLLEYDLALQSIQLSPDDVLERFDFFVAEVWDRTKLRWPNILSLDAPGGLHTALLDLVLDRGYLNKHLRKLDYPMRKMDWKLVANEISAMQQTQKDQRISTRRRYEAGIILEAIGEDSSILYLRSQENPGLITNAENGRSVLPANNLLAK